MCYKGKSEPAYDLATGTITTINQIDIFTKPVYFWVKSNNPRQNSWNTAPFKYTAAGGRGDFTAMCMPKKSGSVLRFFDRD